MKSLIFLQWSATNYLHYFVALMCILDDWLSVAVSIVGRFSCSLSVQVNTINTYLMVYLVLSRDIDNSRCIILSTIVKLMVAAWSTEAVSIIDWFPRFLSVQVDTINTSLMLYPGLSTDIDNSRCVILSDIVKLIVALNVLQWYLIGVKKKTRCPKNIINAHR